MDKYFRVEVLSCTLVPDLITWMAMHQDYSEDFVFDEIQDVTANVFESLGDRIVKHLLKGGRGHFGPLEHPQITFNCGWFPHSTMQQIRTHRVGISFDVQSFRYTGQRITDVVDGKRDIEEVFYLRPAGEYTDREGKRYEYTESDRSVDFCWCMEAATRYKRKLDQGFSEEHARSLIPFDIRQHWVMSLNARSLMHLLDMRAKKDAQLECQWLCDLMFPHFEEWMPEVAEWYKTNRLHKARLAP